MQTLVVTDLGEDFSDCALADRPMPEPAAGELRIRIIAAALNFPDLLMTRGAYQFRPTLPFTPGMECAGIVDALGAGVDAAWLGREVIAGMRHGAMAQYAVVDAAMVRAKPANIDWDVAAAYRVGYLTAWVALHRRGALHPGEWLLVHGGAGGMGLAAVEMGKHLGARVIALASSAEKRATIERLFAPEAVLTPGEALRDAVRDITGGRGADVVFDPVGGDALHQSLRCIAFGGRILVVGFASGEIAHIPTNLPLIKGCAIIGVRAGEYGRHFPEHQRADVAMIDDLLAKGALRPHISAAYPLRRWRDAFDAMRARRAVGKIILRPWD